MKKDAANTDGFPITLKSGSVSARIYHARNRAKYDLYTLAYWANGQRKRENFGALADARARGKQVLAALSKGEVEAANMTLRDSQSYLQALAYLKPTKMSLESACKEYAESFQVLQGLSVLQAARDYALRHVGTVANKTIQQVVDEFIAAKEAGRSTRIKGVGRNVSEKYLDDLRSKLKRFAGRFHYSIGQVRGEEINRYLGEMKVEGRTRNNHLQALGVLFEFAKKQKYLPKDHSILDEVESSAESDFAIEIFTPAQMALLLEHADPALVPVLAIGAFAGLRTAEIERLEWPEIHLEQKFIEVTAKKAKTRARRLAPIPDNLATWLKPCLESSGKVWPHSAPHLFDVQRETAARAGVEWKHNALRHSFISYRLAVVKSVEEVALEAGNSAQMIFKHYRELVTPTEAAKWFALGPPQPANVVPMVKAA